MTRVKSVDEWKEETKGHQFRLGPSFGCLERLCDNEYFQIGHEYHADGYLAETKLLIVDFDSDMIHVICMYKSPVRGIFGKDSYEINRLRLSGVSLYIMPPPDSRG